MLIFVSNGFGLLQMVLEADMGGVLAITLRRRVDCEILYLLERRTKYFLRVWKPLLDRLVLKLVRLTTKRYRSKRTNKNEP